MISAKKQEEKELRDWLKVLLHIFVSKTGELANYTDKQKTMVIDYQLNEIIREYNSVTSFMLIDIETQIKFLSKSLEYIVDTIDNLDHYISYLRRGVTKSTEKYRAIFPVEKVEEVVNFIVQETINDFKEPHTFFELPQESRNNYIEEKLMVKVTEVVNIYFDKKGEEQ